MIDLRRSSNDDDVVLSLTHLDKSVTDSSLSGKTAKFSESQVPKRATRLADTDMR